MEELFQVIKNSASGGVTQSPLQIILNLSLALILGFTYSYVYRLTYTGKKKDKRMKSEMKSMQYTIILLTLGGALIWIVVADNLVRAFGLAGALSLIRYRTVLKEPTNTIKVFYAIILGMSCGLSQYYTAVIGTIFICFTLALIYIIVKKSKKNKKQSIDTSIENDKNI